ncbi:hypothetical protein DICVIV_14113, partial [Dictyocaulus viviparus]
LHPAKRMIRGTEIETILTYSQTFCGEPFLLSKIGATAGRWLQKSVCTKECVTTHPPNQLALKMIGALAKDLYLTIVGILKWRRVPREH